jgi:hypothetical protein
MTDKLFVHQAFIADEKYLIVSSPELKNVELRVRELALSEHRICSITIGFLLDGKDQSVKAIVRRVIRLIVFTSKRFESNNQCDEIRIYLNTYRLRSLDHADEISFENQVKKKLWTVIKQRYILDNVKLSKSHYFFRSLYRTESSKVERQLIQDLCKESILSQSEIIVIKQENISDLHQVETKKRKRSSPNFSEIN